MLWSVITVLSIRSPGFIYLLVGYISKFISLYSFFKRFYLFIFREGKGRRKRDRNIHVWLPLVHPLLGTWPTTQARALTGNRISDPLVHRPVLNPLSHTSQGYIHFYNRFYLFIFRERGREGEKEGEKH